MIRAISLILPESGGGGASLGGGGVVVQGIVIFARALLIGAYLVARIVIAVRSRPFVWVDTGSYIPSKGTQVFSLLGHSPRPWGVPLLFSVLPTNETRALAVWFIGTVAWALLAYALWITLHSRVGKILGAAAILGLALTPAVVRWDFAIGSEALSVTLGILSLALLMIWARTRSRTAFIAMIVAAFWWTFTRQDLLPIIAILLLTLIWYAWRVPEVRKTALVGAAVLALGLGWILAIQPDIEQGYAQWGGSHYTLSNATFLYRLRLVILPDPQMRSAYFTDFQMPHCAPAEQIARGAAWRTGLFQSSVRQCPRLVAWMNENAASVAYKYALKHPKHYAAVTADLAPSMLAGPAGGQYVNHVPAVMPSQVAVVAWPGKQLVLPIVAAVTLLVVAAGAMFRLFRRRIWLYTAGFALVAVSLASTLAGLMYTAGEYARFGIQEAIGLRIGLIFLVIATIDALIMRRAEAGDSRPGGISRREAASAGR
jgi:hypothetical protein